MGVPGLRFRAVNTGPINMGGGPNLLQRSLFSANTPNLPYSSWYAPGAGSPAVSTSDYYLMNGIWFAQPYDLSTMGAEGAAIMASTGFRYVWMLCGDHPTGVTFQGSSDFYVGYSNDPQIWPSPTTVTMLLRQETAINVIDSQGQTQNSFIIYHFPRLVYNPDASIGSTPLSGGGSITGKFWIYAEGQSLSNARQHELSLFTTADFKSSSMIGPVIPTTNFNGWTSLGTVTRVSTGVWTAVSFGHADSTPTTPAYYNYTSTDGLNWTPDFSTVVVGQGQFTTIAGQKYLLTKEGGTVNTYVSLLAVTSSNVSLGTYTRISTAFGPDTGNGAAYPGPTYLQSAWGYEEDGVLSIYASRGFFQAGPQYTLNAGPYLGITPTFFNITASVTSNVMNVTAVDPGSTLAVGQQMFFLAGQPQIVSLGTGTGGVGTYNLSATSDITSQSIMACANGGLWHEFIDQYFYVTDPVAAAGAAPLGVNADCVGGTVTVSWNDCLPNRTYRVYKGSTSVSQTTLVGDVTGTSITDTPTLGQQWWYKVVTLNAGVEQKNRVVHCYASNNTLMVTRHVNRVIDDGGDATKINMTFLASVDAYLTTNGYWKYLLHWVDARFGVRLDGSGFVNKVYCLGTTQLPRGGDYTPTTSGTFPSTSSNTSYSATAFRGTTPAWVNNASNSGGYFGSGRANNLQRKNQLTLIGAYQKPGTAVGTLFGYSQVGAGFSLRHESGSSGNITFDLAPTSNPPSTPLAATVPFASATAAHVAAAVHDGATMTAYLDGVAGTPVNSSAFNNPAMLNDSALRGMYSSTNGSAPVLVSGGTSGVQTLSSRTYLIDSEAQFTCAALIAFEKGLASSDISTIGAMYS